MTNIAVIGAGASGMMAAITAAENKNNNIILLEKESRVGKKILSTGNGRCNLSNKNISLKNYYGSNVNFIKFVFDYFDVNSTMAFFKKLGLLTKVKENGKIYPYTNQANSVLDILRLALNRSNIKVLVDSEVKKIIHKENSFDVVLKDKKISVDKVIVTTGGLAGSQISGTKSGYKIFESLGHKCTKIYPSLVQLKTSDNITKALKGIKTDVKVSLFDNNKKIDESCGELLFTEYGVSGPVIFRISRQAIVNFNENKKSYILLDFLYNYSKEEIVSNLLLKVKNYNNLSLEDFLVGVVNKRLGQLILKYSGYKLSNLIRDLKEEDIYKIVSNLKHFKLFIRGDMGFNNAQVTAGGILTDEFYCKTLESKICKGLFVAGEVLDIDGDCGGYNLQWAWSSGRLAGKLGAI